MSVRPGNHEMWPAMVVLTLLAPLGWTQPTQNELQKLLAADGAADDWFGVSIALSGDTAVIGAFSDDIYGSDSGSAYVFTWDGLAWVQQAKLIPSDGAANDQFGRSVATYGDTIVIGAHYDDDSGTSSGSAYMFVKPPGGWSGTLNEDAKLLASDGEEYDYFGGSVAISIDTVVVGTYGDGGYSGSVCVFVKPGGGWSGTLNENAKLTASDATSSDRFGCSVAISGDTIVVGAKNDDDQGLSSGSAYVFEKGAGWVSGSGNQAAKLLASDGALNAQFALSVALSGDSVAVGAWHDDENGYQSGAAYVFVKPGGGWSGTLYEDAKLLASDGDLDDEFGKRVAISGNSVVVGADSTNNPGTASGSAYKYDQPAGGWAGTLNETVKLLPSDGAPYDYFGSAVAIEVETVLVGANGDDDNGGQSGSAYFFSDEPAQPVTLLMADFEDGLPVDWSADGLWHATDSCSRGNNCDPTQWAYYGQDQTCNFQTGAATSGDLVAPPIDIPNSAVSVTLSYCSAYGGESGNSNTSGYDWAWVEVNGVEVDDVSLDGDQVGWEVRAIDLTAYVGQEIILSWRFDSRDGVSNSELGWQVDGIQVVVEPSGLSALHVDDDAPGGGDGLTWSTAYDDLQDALSAAQSDPNVTTIRVAGGTYVPSAQTDPNNPRTATFQLLNGVTLRGGHAGLANPSQPDVYYPAFYETILSGDLTGNDDPNTPVDPNNLLRNENSYHVVTADSVDDTTVLDGFTITAGNANNEDPDNKGGGIFCSSASPVITHCSIHRNMACGTQTAGDGYGGGIFCANGSPTITHCNVSENEVYGHAWDWGADSYGGGICCTGGSPTITHCTVSGNVASAYPSSSDASGSNRGGGVFCSGDGTISNCALIGNTADGPYPMGSGSGGGVWCSGNNTISNCTISDNDSLSSNVEGRGGGIYCSGTTTISDCTISGNWATWGNITNGGGGGIHCADTTTIINCSILDNSTGDYGGGIHCFGNTTITGCTISGNYAGGSELSDGGGGAVYAWDAPIITGCTITNNSALYGGALFGCGALSNCAIRGNEAWLKGGGLYSCGGPITNCDISRNRAGTEGGGAWACSGPFVNSSICENAAQLGGALCWSTREMVNCVMRGNRADWFSQWFNCPGTPSYSNIQDWTEGGIGNVDLDPCRTPDGHLWSASPCIDAGDPNTGPDPNNPGDIDGDDRVANGRVDIGPDEYVDADGDRLPNWWEAKYFGSTTGADASDDSMDEDGLSNLEEYEKCSSNPIAAPLCVPSQYATIQQAIDAAEDGDTVLVAAGTYPGLLDYKRKSIIVRAEDGSGSTTIDCGGAGRAIDIQSITGVAAVLDGFTIINGLADLGGALHLEQSGLLLRNCTLAGNSASSAGGAIYCHWGAPAFERTTIGVNSAQGDPNGFASDGGFISNSNIELLGRLTLSAGTLELRSSRFYGPGSIVLDADSYPNTLLIIYGESPGDPATVIRANINGTGDILVASGQMLRVEQGATVDLSGRDPNDPNNPCADPNSFADWGTITVDGTLLVRDSTIRNTNVQVNMGDLADETIIYNNEINLLQNPPGWGGEFFVEGTSIIECNVIRSEGDRYLDLDPDPYGDPNDRPFIQNNIIFVTIKQGTTIEQGELLELRSQDFDPNLDGGLSGAYELGSSLGYGDTWAFERLEVLGDPNDGGAKVTLTNRQGFVYQDPNIPTPEVLYTKELKLHSNAILNTGLQRLYYQNLVDENGDPLVRDPNNPAAPMANGSRIVDYPLLGFSLKVIAMDDETEFNVRVRQRLQDPADEQPTDPNEPPLQGFIARILDTYDPNNGIMEIRTKDPNMQAASSVAAHGAFARAAE